MAVGPLHTSCPQISEIGLLLFAPGGLRFDSPVQLERTHRAAMYKCALALRFGFWIHAGRTDENSEVRTYDLYQVSAPFGAKASVFILEKSHAVLHRLIPNPIRTALIGPAVLVGRIIAIGINKIVFEYLKTPSAIWPSNDAVSKRVSISLLSHQVALLSALGARL